MSCHALFIIMKYTEIKTIIDFIKAIKVNNYSYINYLLYGIKPNKQYSLFEIPKKNGDSRQIVSPNPKLKKIQKRIYSLLWQRYEEVMLSKTGKYQKTPSLSHGFLKNRSIITNAQKHRNRKIILNIDLKDFFDSFHFGRVRGFFLKNKYFKLPEEVATILAQLTCYNGKLPQGAPTSPLITNLICEILDYRIVTLSKKYRVTYTRYADDLTFSTNNNSFLQSVSEFIIELTNIIQKSGFEINDSKTHLSLYNQRQEVTGLIVNKKINVRREFYKKTRAMAHNLYKNGEFYIDENNNKGNDNRYKPYSPRETNNGPSYVYNGRVITGDPNNNNTNIFNNTRPGLTGVDSSGRPIGLTGNGNGNVNKTIPKVDKDYPRSGESNFKMVVGIFIITILAGVMYVYMNKLKKIDRKSKKTRK